MRRIGIGVIVGVLVLSAYALGQSSSWLGSVRSDGLKLKDGSYNYTINLPGKFLTKGQAVVVSPYVPPPPADCAGTWSDWQLGEWGECVSGVQTRTDSRTFSILQPPQNGGAACPASPEYRSVTQPCSNPTPTLYGTVDPEILGSCPASVHDTFVVDGGDGFVYRTWHPQTVPLPNGGTCTFAHEHGDDPRRTGSPEIAATGMPAFGQIQRKAALVMQHAEEPHQGFKVFVANPGDVNDEGRVNRVFSVSVFHMGVGGPARFSQPMHSARIRLIHPEFGLKAFTDLMMDTGGVGAVCDPRIPAPTKDVVQLNSPCKLNSLYEIWSTMQSVRNASGREVYRVFATPAVFDPTTVFNPANPSELVYASDPRLAASLNFPEHLPGYANNRGCDRESYAQPGYWYNQGGPTEYWTDAMGRAVSADNPAALRQVISASNSVGAPATRDGLVQFKMRVNYCGVRSALSKKN